jgi:hypothetical protein
MGVERVLTARQLEAILLTLPKRVMEKVEPAVKECTEDVAKRAKEITKSPIIYSKAPYDTGAMHDAIGVEIEKGKSKVGYSIDGKIVINQPAGTNRYYPIYPYEGIGVGNPAYGPRRVLRDAVNLERDNINEKLTKAVRDGLKEGSR